MRIHQIIVILLIGASLLAGCITGQEKGAPPPAFLRLDEYKGMRLFDEKPTRSNYTVLGYAVGESKHPGLHDSILESMRNKVLALGGNALIDLRRETVLESSGRSVQFEGRTSELDHLKTGLLETRYRWTATIVLLN